VSFSRPEIAQVIQTNTQKAAGTIKGRRFRITLIATQVALTFVLLVGAGSAIKTFLLLYLAPLGYDPSNLLTISLQFPDGTHLKLEERQHFYSQVQQAVGELPGVQSVSIYPFGFPPQAHFSRRLELYDQPTTTSLNVMVNPVSREFFETLRIPFLSGSVWSQNQTESAAGVAVVNKAFARRYGRGNNLVGQRIRLPDFTAFTSWMLAHPNSNEWLSIIGIVGDTPNEGLSNPVSPAVYVPYSLVLGDSFNLAIRTSRRDSSLLQAIRQKIHSIDAMQPVNYSETAESILSDEGWATEKFIACLFVVFSALALALAAIGLFSVISFLVTRQYQEFGVRMALGASRIRVVFEVLTSAAHAVATGLVAGFLLCILVNDQLERWTKGSLYDPVIMVSILCILLLVSAVASFPPAWRAATVDPMTALRQG
jgi:predicted permease